MPARGRDIIVIGSSAGGLQALDELLGRLPTDIPAAICIVQHIAPHDTGAALMQRLGKHRAFECKLAPMARSCRPAGSTSDRPTTTS